MEDWKEYTGKTAEEALTNALISMETTSDRVIWEVVEKESAGLLGLFRKEAKIRVRKKTQEDERKEAAAKQAEKAAPKKEEIPAKKKETTLSKAEAPKKEETPRQTAPVKPVIEKKEPTYEDFSPEEKSLVFLQKVLTEMGLNTSVKGRMDTANDILEIEIAGDEMGLLIGKRGQTLDSLQYLVSLVENKERTNYIKVKLDTENYRERRKATLENLAKNIASKVKRTRKPVTLEPMNPYERRIIHSSLQGDRYVETHSEGEDPFRCVTITLKKDAPAYGNGGRSGGRGRYGENQRGQGRKPYSNGGYTRKPYRKPEDGGISHSREPEQTEE